MKKSLPDIVVTSPDGESLIIVEVKLQYVDSQVLKATERLRQAMWAIGCSVGMFVAGEHFVLLRDSFEKLNGESIRVVGEAKLPSSLLPPADGQWQGNPESEFESQIQRWLEQLKLPGNSNNLPDDLRQLLGEPIIRLLQLGEVRAAGPRWSIVAK